MKKFILTITLFILIAVSISGSKTCLAQNENNSVNISYEFDTGFCDHLNQFSIEYEYLLKDKRISLFGRYSTADYSIGDTAAYFLGRIGEDGDIKGVDFGFRFYPIGRKRMDRFFFGGAFGLFNNDWKEETSSGYVEGVYSENVARLDTEVGYRFTTGSKRVSITPTAHLGYYFRDKSTLGIYTGISISVGVAF